MRSSFSILHTVSNLLANHKSSPTYLRGCQQHVTFFGMSLPTLSTTFSKSTNDIVLLKNRDRHHSIHHRWRGLVSTFAKQRFAQQSRKSSAPLYSFVLILRLAYLSGFYLARGCVGIQCSGFLRRCAGPAAITVFKHAVPYLVKNYNLAMD